MKRVAAGVAFAAVLSSSAELYASPCCVSASNGGIGRLKPWEAAAASANLSMFEALGRWDTASEWQPFQDYTEREWRATAVGLFGLTPRALLYGVAPWLVSQRASADLAGTGGGFGDATLGGRYQAIDFGEYSPWPALAVLAQVTAPSGQPAEDAEGTLASDTTGRGAWVPQLGVQLELARSRWFVRLDLSGAVPLPSRRSDTGQMRRFGPSLATGLLAGRSFLNGDVVLGGSLQALTEAQVVVDGRAVPESERFSVLLGAQAAITLDPSWTLLLDLASSPFVDGLGTNDTGRLGGGVGVRYGFID